MIRSAAAFLPWYIRLFMNFASTKSPYLASGTISRRSARRRRAICISLFRPLGAVERTALPAVLDALRVEHAADNVIADARQVLHAAAAEQHDRVLLQIVALTRDVAHHLIAIGQPHFGDLSKRRVGLLWRGRIDARAYAALLGAAGQRRHLVTL